ncbi:serine endoprotease DegP [Candidatus Fukatsuia symbiotica]|uniref:peptidase Do n=1 Tax=Candidatus Fukatsuia symbiotica TaxID=1878942 RepID=A0A2U8I2W8_9GAMM|nr:serine endoprotease DegP [Candidatus Fukatsuia symbiotica]AWK13451.1 serine endoprotease [Candidatus Fukatsuia symbiotica]MEA9444345.1 serine endoprotease DegP [Candidatus Fukatsuia symbiotica]
MKKTILVFSTLALSISLVVMPVVATAAGPLSSNQIGDSQTGSGQVLPSLAPMLENVMPAVVSINIEGSTIVKRDQRSSQFFGDASPFCQEDSPLQNSPFCGGNQRGYSQPIEKNFKALGSGVVIDADKGYVVTNNHVVEHASKIQVQLSDGRHYDAKIIGKDPRTDIALLQLKDFKNLKAMKMADSDKLRVGDYTVAIGNPYGLGETATFGIVSALGRSGLNLENDENFIQTDAAINRGNSGGALVNLQGELIGINTAILAPDGGNIGIGFAIPSNMIKNLTAQMVEFGQVKRGELGIMGTELNAELAKAMRVDAQKGAFISQVLPNSSAAKAGIKAGDVIVKLNNKPVNSFASFRAEIGSLPIGTKMTLGLLRDGKPITINITLEQGSQARVSSGTLYKGIEGAELSNATSSPGVKIGEVKPGSAAFRIGLKKDDIIMAISQQRVQNLADLRKILDGEPKILALRIRRGENDIYLLAQQ